METNISEEDQFVAKLASQAGSFVLHVLLALGTWLGLMFVGYVLNPPSTSQWVILALSLLLPALSGYLVSRFWQSEMATIVWLLGTVWILLFCLWLLDLPTGPGLCDRCEASERIARTLFSFPAPSGLIDNNGPFFATWPAASLIGYSIGAALARKKSKSEFEE
jgi:hypothetical protein